MVRRAADLREDGVQGQVFEDVFAALGDTSGAAARLTLKAGRLGRFTLDQLVALTPAAGLRLELRIAAGE